MSSVPTIRKAIGGFARGLEGFTAQPAVAKELQATGIVELDELVGGGLPRGSLIELCGTSSSGRTGVCLALLARATRSQQTCAFVDACDALDPLSLAAAGADLDRILWVRCGGVDGGNCPPVSGHARTRESQGAERNRGHRPPIADQTRQPAQSGFSWRHPRDQIRGIEASIPSVLKGPSAKTHATDVGSSSADASARCEDEQVERDRKEPRRGVGTRLRSFRHREKNHESRSILRDEASAPPKPWQKLEQALKTTDLLLHSGGWGVVVLDLGSISWVDSRRIPLSTWFRFQRIVEGTATILVLLGEEPCARACASAVVRCRRGQEKWRRAVQAGSGVATFDGFEVEGEVMRSRTRLERFDSAHWQTRSRWSRSA